MTVLFLNLLLFLMIIKGSNIFLKELEERFKGDKNIFGYFKVNERNLMLVQ